MSDGARPTCIPLAVARKKAAPNPEIQIVFLLYTGGPKTFLGGTPLKIKVVVHEAEEGGYWAEVPAIPGCATEGDTFEELLKNLYEAIEGCLSVDVEQPKSTDKDRVLEIAV